jgi:hypothetical protein
MKEGAIISSSWARGLQQNTITSARKGNIALPDDKNDEILRRCNVGGAFLIDFGGTAASGIANKETAIPITGAEVR